MSGTKGTDGIGLVSREEIEGINMEIANAVLN